MTGKPAARFAAQTKALAAKFARQRPLRAGSLLVTVLGDAIAPRGGMIALASMIELAELFGLPERLVRTSIGRLANEDWVTAQRSGRSSYYSLTPNGKVRFAEATQRIYAAPPDAWNGQWTLIVIPPALKKSRDRLREELSWLGFGELTPGVFGHPAHSEDGIRARLAEIEPSGRLIVIQRAVVTQTSDARLAALGWDFDELARRYARFNKTFAPANDALPASGAADADGETAFVLRTLLLHEYRKIHLRDPLLPASLLPEKWAGADAHALCRALYAKVFAASERYLSSTVQTLTGPLPPPAAEIFTRFGGLPRS
jgi:phenylacetic acid degradation operon negative regulatory protein